MSSIDRTFNDILLSNDFAADVKLFTLTMEPVGLMTYCEDITPRRMPRIHFASHVGRVHIKELK